MTRKRIRRLTTKLRDRRRKRPVGRKSREPVLPNRPTAKRGGGSLHITIGHMQSSQ